MMQLVCNGHRLDLYDNTELQFTEDNPLFAFDSIKCERTTNFKLPATPANDRVFALARIPAYAGEGMRRKFPAQLQMGTIVKDGYLYVSSWSGKEYEAIFVTGEMVGLQQLRDAGKLADLVSYSTIQWSPAYVRDANTAAGRARFAITRYKTNANLCMPSYDFAEILDEAYHMATLQTGAWYLPDKISGMRVIAKEINSLGKLPFTFENTPAEVAPEEVAPSSAPSAGLITTTYKYNNLFARVYNPVQTTKTVSGATHAYYIKVQHLICGQTILLTMPDDISPDLFLMSIEAKNGGGQGDPTDPEYTPLAQEWFLGDYSFNYNVAQGSGIVVSGTPLAGKTVKIPARTPFVFINKNAFKWQQQGIDFLDGLWNVGFSGAPGMAYSVTMQSEGASVEQGNVVRIEQVISDITLCEALKIYANLIGKQLYYTDKDGVQFDDLFFISWPRFDISKRLLSIGKVTRTFSDYAQHNLVQFDSADDVPQNTRVITEYTLDNDNISESKEVGKIPFNEGEIDAADGVIVARFDAEDVEKNTLPKYGIAVAGQSQFMERIQLPKNAGIQALCDASTQVEVQARMSAYEYAQITAKTRILCRGTEYVWTSRRWQKDTAKFVLAKLPPLSWGELLVDMGLPSGTKWCSVDIDVTKKHGFAETPFTYEKSFFSWGNIDGHNPTSNTSFAPWNWGGVNSQEPWYQGQVYGNTPGNTLTGNIQVTQEFDAARANLGAPWRMPTQAEYIELFANIRYINSDGSEIPASQTNKLVTINGVVGLYLESILNGARLFFSASGLGIGTSHDSNGSYGGYWSSTVITGRNARFFYFNSGRISTNGNDYRFRGLALRAVQ